MKKIILGLVFFSSTLSLAMSIEPECTITVKDGEGGNKRHFIRLMKIEDHRIMGFNAHASTYKAVMDKPFGYDIFLNTTIPTSTYYSKSNITPRNQVSIRIRHEKEYGSDFTSASSFTFLKAFLPNEDFLHGFVYIFVKCEKAFPDFD